MSVKLTLNIKNRVFTVLHLKDKSITNGTFGSEPPEYIKEGGGDEINASIEIEANNTASGGSSGTLKYNFIMDGLGEGGTFTVIWSINNDGDGTYKGNVDVEGYGDASFMIIPNDRKPITLSDENQVVDYTMELSPYGGD